MGYEKSLPRNNVIFGLAVATAVTLGGLHFVFTSYFNTVAAERMRKEVLGVTVSGVDALKAEARERLETGALPLSRVKGELARGNRPASVTPSAEALEADDLAALEGWTKTPASKATIDAAKRAHGVRLYLETKMQLDALRAEGKPDKAVVAALEAKLEQIAAAVAALGGTVPATDGSAAPVGAAKSPAAPATGGTPTEKAGPSKPMLPSKPGVPPGTES